jgi:phosphoribosylformylglycinamidine synthase I
LSPRAQKLIEIMVPPLIKSRPPSVGKPVFLGAAWASARKLCGENLFRRAKVGRYAARKRGSGALNRTLPPPDFSLWATQLSYPERAMKAAVIVFPGSNCDRDMAVALRQAGADVTMVWHKDAKLPSGVDLVAVPGGFSFGDYLRCGAIAAQSPVSQAVIEHAGRGGFVLGVCNGFQVLTETGLLPGALMRNAGLKFVCKTVTLKVATTDSALTSGYAKGAEIDVPIAHHDGNYFVDQDTLARLKGEDRIAFTYAENPNGAVADIAGVLSDNRRVLGMMPHPERAIDPAHGSTDGKALFASLLAQMTAA